MMQRAAFAVAKHLGKFDDAPLARGEKLFAGKFRRGAQIAGRRRAVGRGQRGGKGVQMNLIAWRDLQRPGIDLDKILPGKPSAQRGHDPAPGQEDRPAVGMNVRGPKGRGTGRNGRHVLV